MKSAAREGESAAGAMSGTVLPHTDTASALVHSHAVVHTLCQTRAGHGTADP
jgi:hypothetical protein